MAERKDFTRRLRDAIVHRDNNHSQMRHYSEEKGWHKNENCPYDNLPCTHLEVHHITPISEGGTNDPDNLITLFKCEHVGVCPSRRIK